MNQDLTQEAFPCLQFLCTRSNAPSSTTHLQLPQVLTNKSEMPTHCGMPREFPIHFSFSFLVQPHQPHYPQLAYLCQNLQTLQPLHYLLIQ